MWKIRDANVLEAERGEHGILVAEARREARVEVVKRIHAVTVGQALKSANPLQWKKGRNGAEAQVNEKSRL